MKDYCENCRRREGETCGLTGEPRKESIPICQAAGWRDEVGFSTCAEHHSKSTGQWAEYLERV